MALTYNASTLLSIGLFLVGLAVLMLLGVATRVRARDSLLDTAPAAVLLLVNAFIAFHVWRTVLPAS